MSFSRKTECKRLRCEKKIETAFLERKKCDMTWIYLLPDSNLSNDNGRCGSASKRQGRHCRRRRLMFYSEEKAKDYDTPLGKAGRN